MFDCSNSGLEGENLDLSYLVSVKVFEVCILMRVKIVPKWCNRNQSLFENKFYRTEFLFEVVGKSLLGGTMQ